MNFRFRTFFLALALLPALSFFSCSTGTNSGDTNVEDSGGKDVHEKSGHEKGGGGTDDNEPGADR